MYLTIYLELFSSIGLNFQAFFSIQIPFIPCADSLFSWIRKQKKNQE